MVNLSSAGSQANTSITITWNAVTQDTSGNEEGTPLYYNIYCETYPYFTPDSNTFLAATTETSYVHTDSRMSDPYVHFYYVVKAVDAWGNQSEISARVGDVDFVLARTKIFLQGAYNAAGDSMKTMLADSGYVPLTSPYSEAPRTVTSIPRGVTDWILVQLRTKADSSAVSSQSFFIKSNGNIVEPDGATTIIGLPSVSDNNYYLVIKHRNHLATMSKNSLSLSDQEPPLYDFTQSADAYYDLSKAIELKQGCWGTKAGDINQDNSVTPDDFNIWKTAAANGVLGYDASDLNFDRFITTSDYIIWYNNFKSSQD